MDITKLPSGTLIDHNRIEREIGRGGSGIVYLAADLEHNCKVALKFLNKESVRALYKIKHTDKNLTPEKIEKEFSKHYESVINRFKEEYQKQLIGIHHPNIASVYQFGFYEGHFFFTSEYIEGYDIFIHTRPMPESSMTSLFIQMFEGLQFIHNNGLLHGDIKPENVLIKEVDGKSIVKIIDFGIAAAMASKKHLLGTPMFIAPEVILEWEEHVGTVTDLFSAAALMYYCLANSYPFKGRYGWGENPKKLAHIVKNESLPKPLKIRSASIPKYLDTIVMRLLEKNPQDRFYGSARAVINALKTRCPNDFKENLEMKFSYLISNKYIGRSSERKEIDNALDSLTKGKQPSSFSIYCISGDKGLGKTYFLQKIRESTEKRAGKISLHSIKFPADDDCMLSWIDRLSIAMDENKYPLVILADDLHLLDNKEDRTTGSVKVRNALLGLSNSLIERSMHPELYKMIRPIIICFTTSPNNCASSVAAEISRKNNIPLKKIELKPFTEKETDTFLKSTVALRGKDIPSDWTKILLQQTGGIPSELREHLVQRDSKGLLFDLDGNVHLFASHAPEMIETRVKISQTTEALLFKQYSDLMPAERHLISFMSVWYAKQLMSSIRLNDLQFFLPNMRLSQLLTDLRQRQILNREYNFQNPYLSDLVYRRINAEEKQKQHSQITEYLRKIPAQKEAIWLHAGLGEKNIIAITSLIKLSRNLIFRKGKVSLAQELLHIALARDGNLKLSAYIHVLLMHAYHYAGQYKIAEQHYKKVLDAFNSTKDEIPQTFLLRFYSVILPVYIALKRFDEALEVVTKAYKIANSEKHLSRYIYFLNWEGRINYDRQFEGKEYLIKARQLYEKSKKLEERLDKENQKLIVNNELGQVLQALGENEAAIEELKRKLNKCKAVENIFATMFTLFALAEALRKSRKFLQAVKYCDKAAVLARKIGHGRWLVHIHSILAAVYFDWKKYAKSLDHNYRCISASTCLNSLDENELVLSHTWTNIGNCYNEMEKWNESPKYFEAALEHKADIFVQIRAKLGLAEVHLHTKRLETSLIELDEADKMLEKLPETGKDLKFVSRFLRYKTLVKQKKSTFAKELLPELKNLSLNNPVFLNEYKKILRRI